MAKTQIIWTVLPYGTTAVNKQRRVSVVISPRLTPQNSTEHKLEKFEEFLYWPRVIDGLVKKFSVEIEGGGIIPLELISWDVREAMDLWSCLFNKDTYVDGFEYNDMRKVKLRSYPVRNILKYLKKHYANLAVNSPSELPRLLPWNEAQPDLKDMLNEAWPKPDGFDFSRFLHKKYMPDEKNEPGPGIENDLYQADRFDHFGSTGQRRTLSA